MEEEEEEEEGYEIHVVQPSRGKSVHGPSSSSSSRVPQLCPCTTRTPIEEEEKTNNNNYSNNNNKNERKKERERDIKRIVCTLLKLPCCFLWMCTCIIRKRRRTTDGCSSVSRSFLLSPLLSIMNAVPILSLSLSATTRFFYNDLQ